MPQRPAGQRPAPVVRNPLLQPNVNVNAQQGGLGIIPTLFGLQNGNGERAGAAVLAPGAAGSTTSPTARARVCVLRAQTLIAPPRRRQRRLHGAAHAGAAAPGLPLAPAAHAGLICHHGEAQGWMA